MPAFKDLPIKRKLSAVILSVCTLVLLLSSGAFVVNEYFASRRELANTVRTMTSIAADNSTAAIAFESRFDAQRTLQSLQADPRIIGAALFDAEGKLFAVYGRAAELPAKPPPLGLRFERDELTYTHAVSESGQRLGTLHVRASMEQIYAGLRTYLGIALGILIVSFVVAFLIATALRRRIAQPIMELAQTTREVSLNNNYAARATKHSDDELGQLTDSFNRMMARIQQSDLEAKRAQEEVRRLNEELEQRVARRTAELAQANKELEAFTYSVSHDLRAPLRHINGFAQMLEQEFSPSLPPEAKRLLGRIRLGARTMGQLVDDLLRLARVGRQQLMYQTWPLQDVVEQVIHELNAECDGRVIDWRVGQLPSVLCDIGLVRQVITNLLSNAVKYSRTRPTSVIEIGAMKEDGEHVISVRDNGVGFEMKYADKLFGVFQRLHRVEDFEGTGVGLAIVQRIVQKHGGRVWAESALGQGACFRFTLPERPPATEETR
ncbi:hypothetical protein DB347_22830 [Opitutaceae bacterium EW11]|nr:hypothetical protein DB347_22830 [Opitutaceae bacterium EW11]